MIIIIGAFNVSFTPEGSIRAAALLQTQGMGVKRRMASRNHQLPGQYETADIHKKSKDVPYKK